MVFENYSQRFKYEVALELLLITFLFFIIYNLYIEARIIAFLILINGIICHSALATEVCFQHYCLYNDLIFNIIFIIYVNFTTLWQPYSLILSLLGGLIYILNKKNNNWIGVLIHIFFVQYFGLITLIYYNR